MNRVMLLFLAPTLIWGSTWYVITHQLQQAPLEWSVFYRFLIASTAMALVVWFLGKPFRFKWSWHPWFALQGFLNYCLNYLCTYRAELTVPSGVVAVTFSLMVVFNILGVWLFFRQSVRWQTILGALMGVVGLVFIFWREIGATGLSPLVIQGLGFALLGTLSASSGNLVSVRLIQSKIPVLSFTFWGMFYGMLSALIASFALNPCLCFPTPFPIGFRSAIWLSLGLLLLLPVT